MRLQYEWAWSITNELTLSALLLYTALVVCHVTTWLLGWSWKLKNWKKVSHYPRLRNWSMTWFLKIWKSKLERKFSFFVPFFDDNSGIDRSRVCTLILEKMDSGLWTKVSITDNWSVGKGQKRENIFYASIHRCGCRTWRGKKILSFNSIC